MRRALTATICVFLFTTFGTTVMAKGKSKKGKDPVSVTLENTCKTALNLTISGKTVALKPGAQNGPHTLRPSDSGAFEYTFGGKKGPEGYIVMASGGQYLVSFSACTKQWANVYVKDLSSRPKGISKNAAAQVRFRAARLKGQAKRPTLESRTGERGRFKRMSAKPSRYVKTTKGDFAYGLRFKGGRRGPVLQTLNTKVALAAGKKYLIEAAVVNKKIVVKVEDEGWDIK